MEYTDLKQLSRRSQQSAIITGIGATIVFVSIITGMWKVRTLSSDVEQLATKREKMKKESAVLSEKIKIQRKEIFEQNIQISKQENQLNKNSEELKTTYKRLQGWMEISQTGQNIILKESGQRSKDDIMPSTADASKEVDVVAIQNKIRPRAKANRLEGQFTQSGEELYMFTAWVDVPKDIPNHVLKVSYWFNHPSFKKKKKSSYNSEKKFAVKYKGKGCLSHVAVTVSFDGENESQIDFDMCSAMGWN